MRHTRASQLVNLSLEKYQNYCGTETDENEVTTWSPSRLLKYSGECKDESHRPSTKVLETAGSTKCIVRKLKLQFLKIEDCSGLYKPQFIEMKEWPQIHFDSLAADSPFQKPTRGCSSAAPIEEKKPKRAYCELCQKYYEDQKKHLKGLRHQTNAKNDQLFLSLDEAIAMGPSIFDTIQTKKQNHKV